MITDLEIYRAANQLVKRLVFVLMPGFVSTGSPTQLSSEAAWTAIIPEC